jgi:hypothetical protein
MRSFYRFQVRCDPCSWDRFCRLESLRFEKTIRNLRLYSQVFPKNLSIMFFYWVSGVFLRGVMYTSVQYRYIFGDLKQVCDLLRVRHVGSERGD